MKIATVVGTRPEIVKLAPVIRELGEQGIVIHTGQHYDPSMAAQFFHEFGIGEPDVLLSGIGGQSRTKQISSMMQQLAGHFEQENYAAMIVQGDTNTVSAAAQAGNYAGIPIIHVEAGLRSYDRGMPEEINRMVAGVLADVHCAATAVNVNNLRAEGIHAERIALTGNTIVEATLQSLAQDDPELPVARELLEGAVLATIHRPENTDTPEALRRIITALINAAAPVVLVAHPRTLAALARHGMMSLVESRLILINPVSHRQLLAMMRLALLVVSDSGGLQEECTVVKTPLIVVRRSTERPESISAGFSQLVTPQHNLTAAINAALVAPRGSLAGKPSPYGDGHAAERIARIAATVAEHGSILHPNATYDLIPF